MISWSFFTAELLRKENIHVHAAKHRQGDRSVLLQYLISIRQTSLWKEVILLSIQFWFTVQHFLHSNTLEKIVNCDFLSLSLDYTKKFVYVTVLFSTCSKNLLQYFLLLVCCVFYIHLLISGWNCELFTWRTLTLHGMNHTIGGTC